MFVSTCSEKEPHEEHRHIRHWIKADLPLLPENVAERLPEEWDAPYLCLGVKP